MFRKMKEARERAEALAVEEAHVRLNVLVRDVRDSLRMRGFTDQVDGHHLYFHSPEGAIVVIHNALQTDRSVFPWSDGLFERWIRGDVTVTQTEGHAVQEVRRVLTGLGPSGRALAEATARRPFRMFVEYEGQSRTCVTTDQPIGPETADRFFGAIRAERIRALAAKHDLPLEYAEAMFDGGAL